MRERESNERKMGGVRESDNKREREREKRREREKKRDRGGESVRETTTREREGVWQRVSIQE